MFFKTEKVAATGYYGIEDPFPDIISKLPRFRRDTKCRLLVVKSHGSQNAAILMLRKLLLLKGS